MRMMMMALLGYLILLQASLQPTPQIRQGAGSVPCTKSCCTRWFPVVSIAPFYRTIVASRRPTFPPSRRTGKTSAYVPIPSNHLPTQSANNLLNVLQHPQLASGGDIFTNEPCVNLAGVAGINALLSTGGVCDQQDNADNMIDFAKSSGVTNQAALVAAAIAYRQHPRNAEDIGEGVVPSTPYCAKQPRNPELAGMVNAQLPGVNPGLFGGPSSPIVAFGAGISHCLSTELLGLMSLFRWHLSGWPDARRFDLFLLMKWKYLSFTRLRLAQGYM